MKYEVKSDGDQDQNFQVVRIAVIQEKTRARIVTWGVGTWLLLLLTIGTKAIVESQHDNAQTVLSMLTPIVTMGFGWYLGTQNRK